MGVPKFYRWTSERYPCLSQVVKEHQIPEFDNLYLDMNGIIHVCSHPNDDDPHFRISEADIFKNIFHYIEVLFRTIKPKQHFFMAVDGVAPRAKMNQQRGRRFRTAKEAEDNIRRALQKGQTLPKEERFDSNCITPGTEFMTRLNYHLRYFVNKKITSDPLWQKCNVYLSGHDVPGEGEHKIMDFIRYQKSKEDYDSNMRHCLYGLDADLIILGLSSHEPHFSLLREEVRFGKQSKRVTKPEETTFHLLHLSLMREYLDFEFGELKGTLPFEYDLEKIIDDWVLLGFLVGNDFIPHLPNLHINHDALPYLYKIYINTMPKLDGYLHDGGFLCLPRFQKFLDAVAKFDREKFEDLYTDMKWLEGRTGRSLSPGKRKRNGPGKVKFSQLLSQLDDDIMSPVSNPYLALADDANDSLSTSPPRSLDPEPRELSEMFGDMGVKDTDGGEELFEMEFRQHKRAYYIEKFNVPTADDTFISTVAYEYLLAIQWILHYYFNGLQSWSWYYPYHYAPFVSDLINTENFDLKLDKGKPFKPFEQLLAVLPSASKKLLPEAFQSLMVMDTSPIIDYYPTSFKTDLNGKQQEWEAVVLIPFIDEQRLLSAMATHYMRLTDEEKERNSYGSCLKYRYSDDISYCFPSSYPGVFKDIENCKASCEKIDKDAYRVEIEDLKKGLCDGVKENIYFPGFPTLKHIDHNSDLRKAGVRVFQFSSKSNNMVIHIKETEKPDVDAMRELVGEIVHVEWPYLVEALVTGVTDGKVKYVLKEPENITQEDVMNKNKAEDADRWMKITKTNYLEKKGIDVGEVDFLVEAKQLKGKRYVCGPEGTVTLEREWAVSHSFYPYQSIVQNLSVHTSQFQKELNTIEELYPTKSKCFMMANPHYGCSGEVLDVENGRVRVALSVPPEPDLSEAITNKSYLSDKYYAADKVSQKIGISPKLLSRITGNLFVRKSTKNGGEGGDKCNIGLKLKFSGRNREVLGYARRAENGWTFSESAINVLRTYVKRFPKIFEKLAYLPEQEAYSEEDIFPGKTGKDAFEKVLSFIKELPCYKSDPVKCGSNVLDEKIVMAIENAVEDAKLNLHLTKQVKVKVKPYVLFKPTAEFGDLVPDPSTEYYLFDRVVNVRDGGAVPLGYRGTVIGVHEVQEDENIEDSPKEIKYEVLFDEPFLGGLMLRCQDNKGAYVTKSSLLNISHGERKQEARRGQTPNSLTKLQEKAEPKSFSRNSSSSSLQNYSPFSPPRSRDYEREGYQFGSPGKFGSPRQSTPSEYTKGRSYGNAAQSMPDDYRRGQSFGSARQTTHSGYRQHRSGDNERQSTPDDYRQGRSGGRQYSGSSMRADYWLKGYGESPSKEYSAVKSDDRYASNSQTPSRDKKDSFNSQPTKSDTDFLKMLSNVSKHEESRATANDKEKSSGKEKQKSGQDEQNKAVQPHSTTEDASQSSNKTLKEKEALLQEMLGIKPSSKRQTSTSPPERIQIPAASYRSPPRQPTNVLNQLFHTPQSPKLMMNVPASPTSPLMQGSAVLSPTASLQNWCHHNQMPAPNYTYSCTPQGVHAVVRIGPAICFGGLMCKSKPDAAESAAEVALRNLLQRQSEVDKAIGSNKSPHGVHFQQMQSHGPNQNPFFQANQQRMMLNQLMSPRNQMYPNMSPLQQQISPAQAQQMQQAYLLYQGQLGFRPPHGPQVPRQPQIQGFPQPNMMRQHPIRSQVSNPQQRSDLKDPGSSKSPADAKKNMGDNTVQAAFVPLQVNRARKKQKTLEEKLAEEMTPPSVSTPSKVYISESTSDISASSTNINQESVDLSTREPPNMKSLEPEGIIKEDITQEKTDSKPKQPKEKAKKKVLLAPSFFAPKK